MTVLPRSGPEVVVSAGGNRSWPPIWVSSWIGGHPAPRPDLYFTQLFSAPGSNYLSDNSDRLVANITRRREASARLAHVPSPLRARSGEPQNNGSVLAANASCARRAPASPPRLGLPERESGQAQSAEPVVVVPATPRASKARSWAVRTGAAANAERHSQ